MALPFYNWSRTAATNATADATVNWAEGMAPSAVNDSARAMMASAAAFRDDITGAIATGGTSTAYTVTSYQVFDSLSHLNGQMIAFTPHTTSGGTVTLNVDSLGAKPLRSSPSVEIPAGTLVQGTPYVAVYNSSDAAFYLQGFFANPGSIPIGGFLPFSATTSPSSSFILPYGQAISRTTYSTYFSLVSTQYGTGDGSTTFNVPDLRGRVIAGLDNMGGSAASRLSGTSITTGGATTMGGSGGAESKTLLTANFPPYTPSGTINNGAITFPAAKFSSAGGGGTAGVTTTPPNSTGDLTAALGPVQATTTFTGAAQGGTSTPIVTIQPTIILTYILRII